MQQFLVFAIIELLCCSSISAQSENSNICIEISIDSLYKHRSVVFCEEYDPGIIMPELYSSRYSPSVKEIIQAEHLLSLEFIGNNRKSFKSFYWNYVRQYIGFTNTKGEKNIVIHLIEYSKPSKVKKMLGKEWINNWAVYFSENPKFSILQHCVNIDTKNVIY